jgi:hypothetical protein
MPPYWKHYLLVIKRDTENYGARLASAPTSKAMNIGNGREAPARLDRRNQAVSFSCDPPFILAPAVAKPVGAIHKTCALARHNPTKVCHSRCLFERSRPRTRARQYRMALAEIRPRSIRHASRVLCFVLRFSFSRARGCVAVVAAAVIVPARKPISPPPPSARVWECRSHQVGFPTLLRKPSGVPD